MFNNCPLVTSLMSVFTPYVHLNIDIQIIGILSKLKQKYRASMEEALVVCGDKSLGVGITVWDLQTGDHILHIPTSASPPNSLICLRKQYLVASQIQNPTSSIAPGVIFVWPLNKPLMTLRNYPVEPVGPLSCTTDGIYLAAGAPSGYIYIWEVTSGRLLKNWPAHNVSITCLVFSHDCSLLISGSEDGMIVVWSLISLLDESEFSSLPRVLNFSIKHVSFITGLISPSTTSNSIFLSSSLDGTCKVWDVIKGTMLQTKAFQTPITAITLDTTENQLFSGTADGRIFVNKVDFRCVEDTCFTADDQQIVLNGHNESITALTYSKSGLISSSEDCTACLWDVVNQVVIRRFNHKKGHITNMLVIPQTSLIRQHTRQKASDEFRFSLLDKYPKVVKGTITVLPSSSCEDEKNSSMYQSADLMMKQILELQNGSTPEAIQLKVETVMEKREWSMRMAKHVMEMNDQLRETLSKLIELRLLRNEKEENRRRKKKVNGDDSSLKLQEEQPM